MKITIRLVHNGLKTDRFLKLRNLNVYYTLPQKWSKKMKMDKCRILCKSTECVR